ncbi:nitrogen assimilation transcriptional regulator NAC [Gluconacetobacter asukensis]
MVALEAEFGRALLTRSPRGVTATPAGRILYHHAHVILKQEAEARRGVAHPELLVSGEVSIGLAPFSTATLLSIPLLCRVRENFPGVILHIRDYFGTVLSELVMNGVLQMAVLYGRGPIRGLVFEPIADEEWYVVGAAHFFASQDGPMTLEDVAGADLLLPSRNSFLRNRVEEAWRQAGFIPHVAAEIESLHTLGAALVAGIGISILPLSVASELKQMYAIDFMPIEKPNMVAPLSLCIREDAVSTPASTAVLDALRSEIASLRERCPGLHPHLPRKSV